MAFLLLYTGFIFCCQLHVWTIKSTVTLILTYFTSVCVKAIDRKMLWNKVVKMLHWVLWQVGERVSPSGFVKHGGRQKC